VPEVAYITYYLKERHTFGDFKIQILDSTNQLVTIVPAGTRREPGCWPMRLKPPKVACGEERMLEQIGEYYGEISSYGGPPDRVSAEPGQNVGRRGGSGGEVLRWGVRKTPDWI
jgi:hypothetical protein